ncbi:MAG TPA: polyprenyl synthetase family protein [Ktedonobacteraceae bacterium]
MVEVGDLAQARRLLCTRLLNYLHGLEPALREDVSAALALEGKLLHQPTSDLDGRWALLPFCLIQELGASSRDDPVGTEAACDVALAMECVVSATDLLDDVMDEDATALIARIGVARALNAALALVSLSQRMLLALLKLDLPVLLPVRLMDMVQQAILLASTGQQWDLLAEKRLACDLTREECLEIAAAKAGALLRLACQMGALCAGIEEARIELCAETGRLLGIAAQLDNDAHDLSGLLQPAGQPRCQKSDLARGKKTLPVVLAAHSLRATYDLADRDIDFQCLDQLALKEQEIYLIALREGALTTWGVALLYRERAREMLATLLGEHSISPALLQVLGLDYTLAECLG